MTGREIYSLLGGAVLIGWPRGTKGTKMRWSHLMAAHMTPEYLAGIDRGNIGVALGAKSGHLVAIDVDDDALVGPFLDASPFLRATLQSHGARGRVFWLRMASDYPRRTVDLKTASGLPCGEFRSNGSQSIISGLHPKGMPYQILNPARPAQVLYSAIIWPPQVANPPHSEPALNGAHTEETEEPEEPEDTEDTQETDEVCARPLSRTIFSIPDALEVSTPTGPNQNYRMALMLARAVKTLEKKEGGIFTPNDHQSIHRKWMAKAANFLDANQTRDHYFTEYLNAYGLAKFTLGGDLIGRAIVEADRNPIPPDSLAWATSPELRRLAAICRELQRIAGTEPFFLSARMVQRIFEHESHYAGARWLKSFCVMGVLTEVEKGKGVRASRYRFEQAL